MWELLIAVANVIGGLGTAYIVRRFRNRKFKMQKDVKNESLYAGKVSEMLTTIQDLNDENIDYSRKIIAVEQRENQRILKYQEIVSLVQLLVRVLRDEGIEIPDSVKQRANDLGIEIEDTNK